MIIRNWEFNRGALCGIWHHYQINSPTEQKWDERKKKPPQLSANTISMTNLVQLFWKSSQLTQVLLLTSKCCPDLVQTAATEASTLYQPLGEQILVPSCFPAIFCYLPLNRRMFVCNERIYDKTFNHLPIFSPKSWLAEVITYCYLLPPKYVLHLGGNPEAAGRWFTKQG